MEKILFLIAVILGFTSVNAQQYESETFINVLVDAEKNIMVENREVNFDDIEGAVKNII